MSIVAQLPKTAIVLPSNVKVVSTSPLILKNIKRSVKKFKMPAKQRARLRTLARRFKFPIITGLAIAPAVLISLQDAMQRVGLANQLSQFARNMLLHYTGLGFSETGQFIAFTPERALVGWAPLIAVLVGKRVFRGTFTKLNRAASQMQLPANFT